MDFQDPGVDVELLIEDLKTNVRSLICYCEDDRSLWIGINLDPFGWWRRHPEAVELVRVSLGQ